MESLIPNKKNDDNQPGNQSTGAFDGDDLNQNDSSGQIAAVPPADNPEELLAPPAEELLLPVGEADVSNTPAPAILETDKVGGFNVASKMEEIGFSAPDKSQDSPSQSQSKSSYKHRHFHDAVFHIEADKIKPNPHQPRKTFDEESLKELADSIRELGIIQPLVVSKTEKETETGADVEYQLIAGERRLMAAKMLGLERVPVVIRRFSQKSEQLEMAIVENLQRLDLNPIEVARAYAKLQDEFNLTQREVAVRVGKSREVVANTLRLLHLPTEIQEAVAADKINESQARLLLSVDDPIEQQSLFSEIVSKNLSVREIRSRLGRQKAKEAPAEEIELAADPETLHLQEKLAGVLGTKVKISKGYPPAGGGGKIVISFFSPEELYGIVHKINPSDLE